MLSIYEALKYHAPIPYTYMANMHNQLGIIACRRTLYDEQEEQKTEETPDQKWQKL